MIERLAALLNTGFNSRARGRARPAFLREKNSYERFNSRARGRARQAVATATAPLKRVSTHAPVGGRDLTNFPTSTSARSFQLTRPWEGATQVLSSLSCSLKFQLTRPWEGATYLLESGKLYECVSTHAPVGGRDSLLNPDGPHRSEFQLTRPWEGATSAGSLVCSGRESFNSRARGRARL